MTTLTQRKRMASPAKYRLRDARTRVYRALYGDVPRPTIHTHDNGNPAGNPQRQLPQSWDYHSIEQTFHSLAETMVKGKAVSNGLFPEQTYAMLVRRLETLRKTRH